MVNEKKMIDPFTSLAFSMFSNKGAYALLLGSGVSRGANIPTGWEIIEDMVRRVAAIDGVDCGDDVVDWYKGKYGKEPSYSDLLQELAPMSDERRNFLKPYFVPTEEERERGEKLPTKAHRAIAKLMKKGYVRVVVTTNFDRLLEMALQDIGVTPAVIATEGDIDGALPLVHGEPTILKINGDFMDVRFLNTASELGGYSDKMSHYFLSILNDFGLITCGWSGAWDSALKGIISSCQNFRFSTYCTFMGNCENELNGIADRRKGEVLGIEDADSFFVELHERIEALERFDNARHPLSATIAVERLKKYLMRDEYRIALYDLIGDERERVIREILGIYMETKDCRLSDDIGEHREGYVSGLGLIDRYIDCQKVLLPMVVNGCYWAKEDQYSYFLDVIKRVYVNPSFNGRSYSDTVHIYGINVFVLIYGMGIACLANEKYDLLARLFDLQAVQTNEATEKYVTKKMQVYHLLSQDRMNKLINNRKYAPVNDFVFDMLRPYFVSLIPDDREYEDLFNLFEFLYLLYYRFRDDNKKANVPARFRYYFFTREDFITERFKKKAELMKGDFAPIKAGLFGGKYEDYLEVVTQPIEPFYG